jgi:hypothetical protein
MQEIWKPIKGYESLYEVSNLGRVKSLNYYRTGKEKVLKQYIDQDGYFRIRLKNPKQNTYKLWGVHRLVAMTFILNPDNKPQINHIDCNRQNNCVENLEWCDETYNVNYGTGIERRVRTARLSEAHISHMKKLHEPNKIAICMIDPITREIIRHFDCGQTAANELHINKSSIYQVCKGIRKTAGGYIWRYEHLLGTTDKPKEE